MLDILAISYKNIGPFQDKILSIFFKNGKYLIKAPIGSGKSFLFFDGPMFGLYKYSSRNILNNKSKEGYIKILYQLHGEIYLIIREIKKSKVKESCTSRLFTINKEDIGNIISEQTNSINNQDIEKLLQTTKKEEITFKNESDLQQTLQSSLPPREVVLNTIFLMQDSSNIFEVGPTERLEVLKNVFNLLGIDEAKEIIAEKKKELNYKIKATTDTSLTDKKLKNHLQNYLQNLILLIKEYEQKIDFKEEKNTLQELKDLEDKLNIQDFSQGHLPITILQKIQSERDKEEERIQSLKNQIENTKKQIQTIDNTILQKEKEKTETIKINQELTTKLEKTNPEIINKLKQEKQNKRKLQEEGELGLPQNLLQSIKPSTTNYTINEAYFLIQEKINEGKQCNDKIQQLQLEIKNQTLTSQQIITQREQTNTSTQQQLSIYQQEITNIKSRIDKIQEHINQETHFQCEKIGTNCPFIKIINQKTFKTLEQQEQELQEQKRTYETKIKNQQDIIEKNKKPNTEEYQEIIKIKEKELQTKEKDKEEIKQLLEKIDRKKIQSLYLQDQQITQEIKNLDIEIHQKETEAQQVEIYHQQLEKNKLTLTHIEEQINFQQGEKNKLQQEYLNFQEQEKSRNLGNRKQTQHIFGTSKITEHDLTTLIEDNKKLQLTTKKLQEEEKILQNLYTIFSKELLLIALQDSLPIINDILNNYLGEVVDFQIQLSLITTTSEKIELEAKIIDQKGEREVKSLSGGQKIILKLTRILAISAYMRSPMIFLDETINNLDQETIGKVADMFQDFMKKQNTKIYTITHSPQIQEMDIWDEIIEIDKI